MTDVKTLISQFLNFKLRYVLLPDVTKGLPEGYEKSWSVEEWKSKKSWEIAEVPPVDDISFISQTPTTTRKHIALDSKGIFSINNKFSFEK